MNINELNQLLDATETNTINEYKDDAYLVSQYLKEISND